MSITYLSEAHASGVGTSATCDKPSGVDEGTVMLAYVAVSNLPEYTPPTGWILKTSSDAGLPGNVGDLQMATFGNTGTTVADVVVQYCDDIVCGLYTLTETANISKLSVFGRSGAGGTQALRGAIFANNEGALGALQGVSSEVIADYNGGVQKWWDMTLDLTGLTAAQYWLLLLYGTENGTQFGLVYDEGGPGVYYKVDFWTYDAEDDPPSPGGAVSLGGANLNPRIYATYTTPSGLSIPVAMHHYDLLRR